ncbi:competence protein ComK [Psychrobacillus sp. FSL H8-0483]|uniref:competence protein ComK n=1 Tax=Psychrobacillus sp. FSL H8-0483 TaxID=2921389 RepID=UPI00315AD2DF
MSKKTEDQPFLVSFETAVLQPIVINNKVFTKVVNFSGESLVIGRKPYDIVRHSCSFYGSSFPQSVRLSREVIGNYLKLPIVIAHDYGNPCILIPILSPKSDLNVWFSFRAIESFVPSDDGCSIVLTNGQKIQVTSSSNTISRQVAFANILNMHFLKRMSHLLNTGFITTRNSLPQKNKNLLH